MRIDDLAVRRIYQKLSYSMMHHNNLPFLQHKTNNHLFKEGYQWRLYTSLCAKIFCYCQFQHSLLVNFIRDFQPLKYLRKIIKKTRIVLMKLMPF